MQSYLLKVGSNLGLSTFVIDENKLLGEQVLIFSFGSLFEFYD